MITQLVLVVRAFLLCSIRRPATSLLYTSSISWKNSCQSIEDFYNRCIGVPVQLLPTILGLKLAVNLDLGSRY